MPDEAVTVKAIFEADSTGGGHRGSSSDSPTPSVPSLPSSVADVSTRANANLSGAVFPTDVTGVTLSTTQMMPNGVLVTSGTAGGTSDPLGAAVYNFAVSNLGLNIIGTPVLYNIKLLDQRGNSIAFTGSVQVEIPLPVGLRGTPHVLRYEESTKTFTDMNAKVKDGSLIFTTTHFSYYTIAGMGDSITLDTSSYQVPIGGHYQIGVKLSGTKADSIRIHSTNDKIVPVVQLKNGNIQVTGTGTGTVWIMLDLYDNKKKFLTHASVRIDGKTGIRPRGDSTRQIGVF